MTRLALASLRSRKSAFVAAFLSVFLGATVIGAFATLMQTASGDMSDTDRESLFLIGTVVGSWGLVIVLFSVASTLTLTVRQRSAEMALLRTTGATPRQTRRMVRSEAVLVSVAAALAAVVPAWVVSRGIFAMLQSSDMVAESVEQSNGFAAIAITGVALVVVSYLATSLSTRRAAKMSVRRAQTESAIDAPRMGRWKVGGGIALMLLGLNYSIITMTVMKDDPEPMAAMSTAGPACIFWALGLAVLAPKLMQLTAALSAGVLERFGPAGYLASHDARRRSHQLAGALSPVIVFIGIATGTLYLVAIENSSSSAPQTAETRSIELLNYVVVGMISVFAAIMIVNTIAAVIAGRRREFGQQRLAGATPEQVRQAMLLESGLIAVSGVVWGAVAALGTIVPYSYVKTGDLMPTDLGPWAFIGVVLVGVTVIVASTRLATRHALRPAAVNAVALQAA